MITYNVILKKDIDYQSFWDDMESDTDGGNLYIPNRIVNSTNRRENSQRQIWYTLSDEEVEAVRNDERVLAVELPPEDRTDIILSPRATQDGTFTKSDMLFESLIIAIKNNPLVFFLCLIWLFKGRAHLKYQLSQRADIPTKLLPLNPELYKFLLEEKANGRKLILATASNEKYQ
mgnify:CR=1 FL=1